MSGLRPMGGMGELLADDLLLDRLAGRGDAGPDPVAGLLGALAAHADRPLPARTGRRRSLNKHRYLGAFAALAIAASGAGVAAAVTQPDGWLFADRARVEQRMEHDVRSGAPTAPLSRVEIPSTGGTTAGHGLVLAGAADGMFVLLPAAAAGAPVAPAAALNGGAPSGLGGGAGRSADPEVAGHAPGNAPAGAPAAATGPARSKAPTNQPARPGQGRVGGAAGTAAGIDRPQNNQGANGQAPNGQAPNGQTPTGPAARDQGADEQGVNDQGANEQGANGQAATGPAGGDPVWVLIPGTHLAPTITPPAADARLAAPNAPQTAVCPTTAATVPATIPPAANPRAVAPAPPQAPAVRDPAPARSVPHVLPTLPPAPTP